MKHMAFGRINDAFVSRIRRKIVSGHRIWGRCSRCNICLQVAIALMFVPDISANAQSSFDATQARPAKLAVKPEKFREGFRETTNVSGSVLAGLALGTSTGVASISEVYISASGMRDAESFCLHVLSRDGQFWSENPFLAPRGSDFWSVHEITIEHKGKLSGYKSADVLIAAGLVPSRQSSHGAAVELEGVKACELKDQIIAPTIAESKDLAGPLRAYINSEGRYAEVELWQKNKRIVGGRCERPEAGGTPIFDRICTVELPPVRVAGVYQLKLIFDAPPFGFEEWIQSVALPGSSSKEK